MFIVPFKVGDQQTAKDKEHLGIKDGMPVCLLEENVKLSDHMLKVFACVKFDEDMRSTVIESLLPNQNEDQIVKDSYRARKNLISFSELESKTGVVGLETALRSSNKVSTIDCTKVSGLFKTSDTLNPEAKDLNSISSGNYTVGSDGDYASFSAATSDLANLTGDITLAEISDVTETSASTVTIDLGGHTLTITSNSPHYGDPNSGWELVNNQIYSAFQIKCEGSGTVIIENLHYKRSTNGQNSNRGLVYIVDIDASFDLYIHDNLIDGGAYTGGGISFGDPTPVVYAHNNVVWDMDQGFKAITSSDINASSIIENNTVYDCSDHGFMINSAGGTFRNNVTGGITNADFDGIGSADGYNNASEDATAADGNWSTGSGNETSITVSTEFVSTDDTDPRFLKITNDGVCDDGGTTPGIDDNDFGIRGNARPGVDTSYSIGADEWEAEKVFYSVGQDTSTDNKTGSPNISISSGVATFTVAQTGNIGVGDRITHAGGDGLCYITKKQSSTVWYVSNETGGNPTDVSGQSVTSIKREYASLSAAEAGCTDANHLNDTDTTASGADVGLYLPCYYDTGADTTAVVFSGITTDNTHKIKVYTPNDTEAECNTSQRHSGVWNTSKWRIERSDNTIIEIAGETFLDLEGLQLRITATGSGKRGINITFSDETCTINVSHSIIRGSGDHGNSDWGIGSSYNDGRNCTIKAWNNILYDWDWGGSDYKVAAFVTHYGDLYAYNNTVHDCAYMMDNRSSSDTLVFKNNAVKELYSETFEDISGIDASSTANASDDDAANLAVGASADSGTTDGASSNKLIDSSQNFASTVKVGMIVKNTTDTTYTYVTAVDSDTQLSVNDDIFASGENYTIYTNIKGAITFKDEGSDDFHLANSDTVAQGKGVDLYSDSDIAVTDDIDGDARPNDDDDWDIGADQLPPISIPVFDRTYRNRRV